MVSPGTAAFALKWLDFHRSTTSSAALCGESQIFSDDHGLFEEVNSDQNPGWLGYIGDIRGLYYPVISYIGMIR